jgi:5-methylcytosine-specific restriction endonuclease McrA
MRLTPVVSTTDQAHGHPRQVGPAYQKTRRPVSRPNRPSWQPTRPPEDLLEDSPDDLIQNDIKTWRARQGSPDGLRQLG